MAKRRPKVPKVAVYGTWPFPVVEFVGFGKRNVSVYSNPFGINLPKFLSGGLKAERPAQPAQKASLGLKIQGIDSAVQMSNLATSDDGRSKAADLFSSREIADSYIESNKDGLSNKDFAEGATELRDLADNFDLKIGRINSVQETDRLKRMAKILLGLVSSRHVSTHGSKLIYNPKGILTNKDDLVKAIQRNIIASAKLTVGQLKDKASILSDLRLGSEEELTNLLTKLALDVAFVKDFFARSTVKDLGAYDKGLNALQQVVNNFRSEVVGTDPTYLYLDFIFRSFLGGQESEAAVFGVNFPGVDDTLQAYAALTNEKIGKYRSLRAEELSALEKVWKKSGSNADVSRKRSQFQEETEKNIFIIGDADVIYALARQTDENTVSFEYKGDVIEEIEAARQARGGTAKRGILRGSSATLSTLRENFHRSRVKPIWDRIKDCESPAALQSKVAEILADEGSKSLWEFGLAAIFGAGIAKAITDGKAVSAIFNASTESGSLEEMKIRVLRRLVGSVTESFKYTRK